MKSRIMLFVVGCFLLAMFYILNFRHPSQLYRLSVSGETPHFEIFPFLVNSVHPQFHVIMINELSTKGNYIKNAWTIYKTDEKDIRRLSKFDYGILPDGWSENSGAKPLKADTFYELNGQYFFKRVGKGKYLVRTLQEFNQDLAKF